MPDRSESMADIIVIAIILVIVAGAIAKIVSEKKKGAKCVGCPYSNANGSGSGCSCNH